jgi:hypothetical protein
MISSNAEKVSPIQTAGYSLFQNRVYLPENKDINLK